MAPVAKKGSPANAAGEDKEAGAERVVTISGEQHAREELARDMAAMRENPMDTAKQPGGVYRVGGVLVDANGKPVKVKDEDDE